MLNVLPPLVLAGLLALIFTNFGTIVESVCRSSSCSYLSYRSVGHVGTNELADRLAMVHSRLRYNSRISSTSRWAPKCRATCNRPS